MGILKKENLIKVGIFALMLVGFSLLLYPFVANKWNNYRQEQLVSNYEDSLDEALSDGTVDVEAELAAASQYNEDLLPSILPDSFSEAEANGVDDTYMSLLNVNGDGIMGYIQIPKIAVKLPIFHTTDDSVLEIGVGHLEGSSLPVGGESTHCVLSAHRGLPSASLFTDLDQLEEGDNFFLIIEGEYFAYEVDKITVCEPTDTSALAVEYGEDLCTLVTCTPYGVNTERLMVRGHRVEYTPELLEDAETPLFGVASLHTSYLLWVIVGLLITGLFILLLYLYDKKKKKENENEGI